MIIEEKKPRYTMHNGFRMPMGFPPEAFSSGLSYQPQPGDIFIAAYPKCGTTWVQYIVWLIIHDGEPLPPGKRLREAIPMLEGFGKEFVAALPSPRAIKTHLPYQMTPYHPEAKYIHVCRNPFDCAVSFYHHTKGFMEDYDFVNGSFDEYFECFIAGEVDWGDYFDNLLSWYEHKNAHNVLCLTYENLKNNPQEAVNQIAAFLGSEYLDKVKNEQILNKILTNSSFERMSQDPNRWATPRPDNMPFIRKGQIGDWKNYFSEHQTKRLTEKFVQRTKGTDLEKLWSNLIPCLAAEEANN